MNENQHICDNLSDVTEPDRGSAAMHHICIPANRAKQLGRTSYHANTDTLWCSHSASGIAFGFRGRTCTLRLIADSAYQTAACAARYAVYLNETLIADALLTEPERILTIQHPNDENVIAWVRLVKLSESAMSALGIQGIRIAVSQAVRQQYQENVFLPAADHCRRIEFIGDSITCGYGIDGQCGEMFRTSTENAEKSYAYLTAARLNADYSMVCCSGYGIISGYTADGIADTLHLVPPLYAQIGHCAAVIEDSRTIDDDLWDFAVQSDLVVINLGTNDASYTGDDAEKQADFAKAYRTFLHTVRRRNPDVPILCTLGTMGQTLCSAVELAVSGYSADHGDDCIRTMRFDMQDEADGMAVDWHPSALTHEKAAAKLCREIHAWLGW